MTRNPVRQALCDRSLTVGTWLQIGHPAVAEVLATVGFDWIAADCEHTDIDPEVFGSVARAMHGRGPVPLARVRENDVLASKIHEFTLQLMSATNLNSTIAVVEEAMRSGFDADHAVLVLFGDPDSFDDINCGRFFRALHREDAALGPFATFLKGRGPRCGQVRDTQSEFLFKGVADEIGSVALVPLGKKAEIGFLAIGSTDADRFHPGMSIDFLSRVSDLVSGALKRF